MGEQPSRIYLYAVVDGDASLSQSLFGFAPTPVWLLPVGKVAAVVGAVAIEQIKETSTAALVHEEVIEKLMAERRVLPVRFGAVFSSVEALSSALAERHDLLYADLRRLDGRVEVGVRILWDGTGRRVRASDFQAMKIATGSSQGAGGPGMEYMRARMTEVAVERHLRQEAEELGQRCRAILAPYASALRLKTLVTEEIPVSVACLVSREAVGPLVGAANRLHELEPDIRAVCTGPWPPYHFVTDSEGA